MNINDLIKVIKDKIQIQDDDDDDYWQEIKVGFVLYDCNIYERAEWDDKYNAIKDTDDLIVDVYHTEPDEDNPGFVKTNTNRQVCMFNMSSKDLKIVTGFNKTLIIQDVNFERLDEQRLVLAGLLMSKHRLSKKRLTALDGILDMLDTWSNNRYFNNRYFSGEFDD